jgi:urease gamma subunit
MRRVAMGMMETSRLNHPKAVTTVTAVMAERATRVATLLKVAMKVATERVTERVKAMANSLTARIPMCHPLRR